MGVKHQERSRRRGATAMSNSTSLTDVLSDCPGQFRTRTVTGGPTESQAFIGNNVYSFSGADVSSTTGDGLTFDARGNISDIFILKDINSRKGDFTDFGL